MYLKLCLNYLLHFALYNSTRSILYLHYIILVEKVPLGDYTLPLSTAEVVEEGRHLTVTIFVYICSLFLAFYSRTESILTHFLYNCYSEILESE